MIIFLKFTVKTADLEYGIFAPSSIALAIIKTQTSKSPYIYIYNYAVILIKIIKYFWVRSKKCVHIYT